ncbi:MAG: hypothetical protein L6Q77_00800 [Bacteroidetes bacterium]|nr:hypothetical protein [Bacteroidota bacterium]
MWVEKQTQPTKPPGHNPFSGFGLIQGENAPNRNFFVFDDPLFREKWAKPSPESKRKGSFPLKPAVSKVPLAAETDRKMFLCD